MSNIVRTDNMSATHDPSLIRSAIYEVGEEPTEIDNGMVVLIGGLVAGEREIRKATTPAANSALNDVALVASPEYMADPTKRSLSDFTNNAGDVIRCFKLHPSDIFSVTAGCFDTTPAVGDVIELMAGTTFKAVKTATAASTTVGKVIAIENDGNTTFYVVEVK